VSAAATLSGASSEKTSPGVADRPVPVHGLVMTATATREVQMRREAGLVASHGLECRLRCAAGPDCQEAAQRSLRDVDLAVAGAPEPEHGATKAMTVCYFPLLIHTADEC
jgi:hypothetical protein